MARPFTTIYDMVEISLASMQHEEPVGNYIDGGERAVRRSMEETNYCDPRDAETLRRIDAGDINAFEDFIERYGGFVLGVVKKHIPLHHAEDITQDVFLKTYRSLSAFEGRSSFRHWLSVIAVRTCCDFWREQYKSRELPISSLTEEHEKWLNAAMSEQSDQAFIKMGSEKEAAEVLDWAMERLSPQDRMVLELVYLEDHTVKEAARLLGLSVANVKVRLFRSRKKLHTLITAIEGREKRSL